MQTSFQRALEMAEARAEARRAESWRFWAGYEHASVGECRSSTEAAAMARIEVQARGRRPSPPRHLAMRESGKGEWERGGAEWGGIGMVDIIAAWRVACAEHDAKRGGMKRMSVRQRDGVSRAVDRVIQWG